MAVTWFQQKARKMNDADLKNIYNTLLTLCH